MVRDQNDTTGEKEREYANLLRQEQLRDRVQQMYAPDFDFTPPIQQNSKIDTPEKEREAAARLRRARQTSKVPQTDDNVGQNLASDDSKLDEIGKQEEDDQNEKEQEWTRRMNMARHAARVAELGSRLYGQGNLADAFGDIGDIAGAGEGGADAGPDAVRRVGSNLAGSKAGKIAQKRGLSGGKSAALGGALSSALQGEGVGGIAKGALSWYLLYIAFGALFTLVGSIPALLYLNFHYIMSKFGSKIFGEMFLWQKLVLLFANIMAFFVIMIIVVFIVIIADPCILADSVGTWWADIFGVVCKVTGN